MQPVPIVFGQAMAVAAIGLVVNLASAWLPTAAMTTRHGHHHGHLHGAHAHHHDHDHQGMTMVTITPTRSRAHGGDNNLRAAYLHVVADAFTSVLAIAALLGGSLYGWVWLDP